MLQVSKDFSAIQSWVAEKAGVEKLSYFTPQTSLPPFSLKGPWAVRFQRLRQANAMRSQIDDVAKAG
jgi:hypothetical protein